MIDNNCLTQNVGRQRLFWTTRPSCGEYTLCGVPCAIPGLEYEDRENDERTIKTEEPIRSLVLNILNTRARNDVRCPTPAAVFGHWSESYRQDGLYIGSTLWNAASRAYIRIADAVRAIEAAVQADLSKLIALQVADTVDVIATYRGRNMVEVVAEITSSQGRSKINLSGSYVSETWIWH